MPKPLLKLILMFIYFIETTGVGCLPLAIRAEENSLRPMASVRSGNTSASLFVKTLRASSAGRREDTDIEELSRQEKLNLILEKNPELDTPETLLEYINKNDPHLLDAISSEKQLEFLRDFMFLGYETIPLPKEVCDELISLGRHWGKRIKRIREVRNIQPADILTRISEKIKKGIARSKKDIVDSTYSDIENSKEIQALCWLFDICRELRVDPIFITDARDWVSASGELPDNEKMRLCRLRKGWNQQDCAIALEKAGLDFGKKSITTKTQWVSKCERGKITPTLKEAEVIRRVYCDKTLFEEVEEGMEKAVILEAAPAKGPREKVLRFLAGVKQTEIHRFLAGHPEVRGTTPSEIERDYKISARSIRDFLKKHPIAVDTYGIKFPEEKKPPGERPFRPPKAVRAIPSAKPIPSEAEKLAELTRADKLNRILEENPELDTAEKFLAYINKKEPQLLDAISREKRLEFLRDFISLGYETIPLSKAVLEQLPGMTAEGARMDVIKKARKMETKEVCKSAGIEATVYKNMVKEEIFRRPERIFKVAKALKTDLIYIIKGKGWDEVAPDLEDKDKMFFCRFRKGWTQKDFIIKLEVEFKKTGLKFGTATRRSKEKIAKRWESGELTPEPEERKILRKVLGESTLYQKADEIEKAMPEGKGLVVEPSEKGGPKYLRGVRRTKTHIFFAEHWQDIKGLTPSEIERDFGIPAVTTRVFLRQNKGAAEIYDIDFSEEGKKPLAKGKAFKKEKPFLLPSATEAKKPRITAERAAEIAAEEAETTEAEAGRRPGKVIIEEPEADYAVYTGGDVIECLRTPGDRELVDGMDIEDAIYDLEDICAKIRDLIEKEASPERQKKIIEQWRLIKAKDILQRLKPLVSTELCDWDIPEIGQKAAGITKGLVDDSERVENIKEWVEDNIKLVPEYKGCWNTRVSETLGFLKGTYFNRANLIVAMLRSIGIPCRYRIISFKKGKAETEEHILVEALITIEEHRNKITDDIYRKCEWMSLEPIDAEKVIESYVVDNIDEYAGKKAKESRRKGRGKRKGQRETSGRIDPWQQLKGFKAISRAG